MPLGYFERVHNEFNVVDFDAEKPLNPFRLLNIVVRRGQIKSFGRRENVYERFFKESGTLKSTFSPGNYPEELVAVTQELRPSLVVRVLGSIDAREEPDLKLSTLDSESTVRQIVERGDVVHEATDKTQFEVESYVARSLKESPQSLRAAIDQLLSVGVVNCVRATNGLVLANSGALATMLDRSLASTVTSSDTQLGHFVEVGLVGNGSCQKQLLAPRGSSLREVQANVAVVLDALADSQAHQGAGVVFVLVGGSFETCGDELLHAVRKRWPIFVVEHSGGYAEYLSSVVRRIESICPSPGIDDFRAILAGGDATVAEILINGDVHIVSPGCNVKEFQHAVFFSTRGDETLKQAWNHYAHWQLNEEFYEANTRIFQIIILTLGLLTMTLTIVQCFLQLLYPGILDNDDTSELSTGAYAVRVFMLGNNLALIILPILSSLFQAILFKLDPASKYVTLRRCSQLMLREIYMYRTETRGYSPSAVNRQKQKLLNTTVLDEEGEPLSNAFSAQEELMPTDIDEKLLDTWADASDVYLSKQDLLFRRIAALSDEMSNGIADAPMREYTDSIPPLRITSTGDDGMSNLSPDQYVRFRLESAQLYYVDSSKWFRQQYYALTYSVYLFGSIGTMLAAFAVYGSVKDFNLQFWVALTTSAQNALSRFLDYTRVEHLMQEHSKAKEQLTNVTHWWSQLQQPGIQTDSQAHRDALVGKVETCITREVELSGSHMKNLNSRIKKAQEQQAAETEKVVSGLKENPEAFATEKIQAIGIQQLSPENIKAALQDPTCPASAEIVKVLDRIEELNEMIPLDDEELEKLRKAEEHFRHGNFTELLSEGLKFGEWIPIDVLNMLRDPKLLPRFADEVALLGSGGEINRQSLIRLASVKAEFSTQISSFPLRRMLLVFKKMLEEVVVNQFEESLRSIQVNLYSLVQTRGEAQSLIGELGFIVSSKDWHEQVLDQIVNGVRDQQLQRSLRALGESTIRAMLKRAERFFAAKTGGSALLQSVTRFIAILDVDELMSDSQSTLDRAVLRKQLLDDPDTVLRHSRHELLELLPPSVRRSEAVAQQSKTQLVAYFNEIINGGFEFDFMDVSANALALWSQRMSSSSNSASATQDPPFLRSAESRARFFFCCCDVPHDQIYSASHDVTLRHMAVSPFFTQSFATDLRTFEHTRLLVSICRTTASNSYQMHMFRQLCRAVVNIDVDDLINTLHDRLCFVNLIVDGFVSCDGETPSQILLGLTPRIASRLQPLELNSLIVILGTAYSLCTSTFGIKSFANLADDTVRDIVSGQWSRQQCNRLLYATLVAGIGADDESIFKFISDRQVVQMYERLDEDDRELLAETISSVADLSGEGSISVSAYLILDHLDQRGVVPTTFSSWKDLLETLIPDSFVCTDFVPPPIARAKPSTSTGFAEVKVTIAQGIAFIEGPFVVMQAVSLRCKTVDFSCVAHSPLQQYLMFVALDMTRSASPEGEEFNAAKVRNIVEDEKLFSIFEEIIPLIRTMSDEDIVEVMSAFMSEHKASKIVGIVSDLHRRQRSLVCSCESCGALCVSKIGVQLRTRCREPLQL